MIEAIVLLIILFFAYVGYSVYLIATAPSGSSRAKVLAIGAILLQIAMIMAASSCGT